MKMQTSILAIIFIGLAGCVTAKKTYAPDGREAFTIECSGQALNWGMCYQKAGELCGAKGYDTIVRTGDEGGSVTATQYGVIGGSVITRSLVIACKQ